MGVVNGKVIPTPRDRQADAATQENVNEWIRESVWFSIFYTDGSMHEGRWDDLPSEDVQIVVAYKKDQSRSVLMGVHNFANKSGPWMDDEKFWCLFDLACNRAMELRI